MTQKNKSRDEENLTDAAAVSSLLYLVGNLHLVGTLRLIFRGSQRCHFIRIAIIPDPDVAFLSETEV